MPRAKAVSPVTSSSTEAAVAAPAEKKPLTSEQIILGATNDPSLSTSSFKFNDKEYKYVHLSYDAYIEFMLKIKQLLTAVVGTVAAKANATVKIPGIALEGTAADSVINFASKEIPDMVRIIVNNCNEFAEVPDRITVEDIKKVRGITPMTLTNIIMGQVVFNNMIPEFASFFVQMMPLLKQVGILKEKTSLAK